MAKRGFNDEDYNHHDGPFGDPHTWRRKAGNVVTEKRNGEEAIQTALAALGFSASARPSGAEVKTAYRQAALKNHPDQGGSNESFQEVKTAFDILLSETEFD